MELYGTLCPHYGYSSHLYEEFLLKKYDGQMGIFEYLEKFFPACFYWCYGSYYTGLLR